MQVTRRTIVILMLVCGGLDSLPAQKSEGSIHRWYHDKNKAQWWACEESDGFILQPLPSGELKIHRRKLLDDVTWKHIERMYHLESKPYKEEMSSEDCIETKSKWSGRNVP